MGAAMGSDFLPALFESIRFDKARAGNLFLFVIALAGAMTAPWVTGNLAQTHGLARAMLVPVIGCTMIIVIQLVIIGTSRRTGD